MAHVFVPDPRPQTQFLWLSGISLDLSDPHHFEKCPLQSFCPPNDELTPSFSSSELMLLCQPVWLASRQKWAGPISAPPADASTFG